MSHVNQKCAEDITPSHPHSSSVLTSGQFDVSDERDLELQ